MKEKKFNKLVELLKSGNFSILYHDNGSCHVYDGKPSGDKFVDEWVGEEDLEPAFEVSDFIGYMPLIVSAFIDALGGRGETM